MCLVQQAIEVLSLFPINSIFCSSSSSDHFHFLFFDLIILLFKLFRSRNQGRKLSLVVLKICVHLFLLFCDITLCDG